MVMSENFSLENLVSSKDVADALKVHFNTVNAWGDSGIITPAFTYPNGQRLWDLNSVLQELEEHSRKIVEERKNRRKKKMVND